jgi:hypothetical protein
MSWAKVSSVVMMNINRVRHYVRNKPLAATCLVFALTVLAVFGNSLRNGFVWDDKIYIVNNPIYRECNFRNILATLANGVEYLPIRDLSYALDFAIGGGTPFVFHLSNLVIYCLTTISVFGYAWIAYRYIHLNETEDIERRSFTAGFFTALLFAVHPIHSEVVSFITCRNALLSTLFFFIATSLFVWFLTAAEARNSARICAFVATLVFFILSLFSKANSIILPLILFLHVLYLQNEQRRRGILSLLPFITIAVIIFFLFTTIARKTSLITDSLTNWTLSGCISKFVKAQQIVAFYLWKLAFPFDFSAAYDTKFAWSPATPSVIALFVGSVAIMLLAFCYRRKAPYLFFGICWYVATLVPVLNFFSTSPVVADRYAFLPSFAFFFIVASAGVHFSTRTTTTKSVVIGIIITLFWGTLAADRNTVWFSDETLWEDTIRTSPNNSKGYRNLGDIYLSKGEYAKAISTYSAIADTDPLYFHTIGFVALRLGDLQGAAVNFKKSLGRDPQFIGSLYYLGSVYQQLGQTAMAAELFKHTLQSPQPDLNGLKASARERLHSLGITQY